MRGVRVVSAVVSVLLLAALAPGSAVAGVKRFYFAATAGDAPKQILHAGGLKLRGECLPGMAGAELAVTASSDQNHASIHANLQPGGAGPTAYAENDNLIGAETLPLLGAGGMPFAGFGVGQIAYSKPNGKAVTASFIAGQNVGTANICRFAGTARVAPSGPGLVSYRAKPGSPPKKFFARGGLVLTGHCDEGEVLSIDAHSGVKHASIHANAQSISNGLDYRENDNLKPKQRFTVLPAEDSAAGQFIYSTPKGRTVTIDYLAEEDAYGTSKCAFVGTDDVAGPKSPQAAYYAKDAPSPKRKFFKRSGLTLSGTCDPGPKLLVRIRSEDSVQLYDGYNEQFPGAPEGTFGGGSGIAGSTLLGITAAADDDSGQIVLARDSNKSVVTVDFLAEEGEGHGGRTDCLVAGTARVLKP